MAAAAETSPSANRAGTAITDPIVGLKDHADPARAHAKLLADLFGLDPDA